MEIAIQGKAFLSPLSHFPLSNPKGVLLKFRPAPQSLPLLSSKSKSPFLRMCTHGGGRPRIVACSNDNNLDGGSMSSSKEASFDLKLSRRNLIVQFTCNVCGERTERTVNKVAYQRGTVFVQCAGCLVHHKLVDNLGLVVEYDLRNELDADYDDAPLE